MIFFDYYLEDSAIESISFLHFHLLYIHRLHRAPLSFHFFLIEKINCVPRLPVSTFLLRSSIYPPNCSASPFPAFTGSNCLRRRCRRRRCCFRDSSDRSTSRMPVPIEYASDPAGFTQNLFTRLPNHGTRSKNELHGSRTI